MCDETDLDRFNAALARRGLSRREFAAMGSAVLLWACGGSASQPSGAASSASGSPGLGESTVSITTPHGEADAFFVHPAAGRHPAVLLWPDIAGLREAFRAMARRLAREGYAVLVVNPYYRNAAAPQFESFAEWMDGAGRAKVEPWRKAFTPEAIASDAAAYVQWLDRQPATDTSAGVGTMGFCMGGPFTIRTAAAVPGRVAAAASFHGGGLVTPDADSPHLLIPRTSAAYLVAIAQDDDAKKPDVDDTLRATAKQAGRPAEVEVYPADHGWTVGDSPAYQEAAAEGAWQRLLVLFADNLKPKS